jgi:hypothetical protein
VYSVADGNQSVLQQPTYSGAGGGAGGGYEASPSGAIASFAQGDRRGAGSSLNDPYAAQRGSAFDGKHSYFLFGLHHALTWSGMQ